MPKTMPNYFDKLLQECEEAMMDSVHTLRYGADGSEPDWVKGSLRMLEDALFKVAQYREGLYL